MRFVILQTNKSLVLKSGLYCLLTIFAISLISQSCSRKPIYRANLKESVCNAVGYNTCDWMSDVLREHPSSNIALVNLCLPGSHDAGMYMTQHCTAFANVGNTQTQYLPMKQQLEAGLRIFDLRPWVYDGEFYTHHSMHCDGLGCKGDKLIHILQSTKEFLDTHHEVVLLELTHFCHTSASDTVFLSLLTNIIGDHIYRETKQSNTRLIQTPLTQILKDAHSGKVILR
jgi:hypothetical protein